MKKIPDWLKGAIGASIMMLFLFCIGNLVFPHHPEKSEIPIKQIEVAVKDTIASRDWRKAYDSASSEFVKQQKRYERIIKSFNKTIQQNEIDKLKAVNSNDSVAARILDSLLAEYEIRYMRPRTTIQNAPLIIGKPFLEPGDEGFYVPVK